MLYIHRSKHYDIWERTSEYFSQRGRENFILLEAPPNIDFPQSLRSLFEAYHDRMQACGLSYETEVFLRFHLSDIANQAGPLKDFLSRRDSKSGLSLVGQLSTSGSKISLEAYHLKGCSTCKVSSNTIEGVSLRHGSYRTQWLTSRPNCGRTSGAQTKELFDDLSCFLDSQGLRIKNNLIRTWLYLRDIDNDYLSMARTRRELFENMGLNSRTHYISSTGINGIPETLSARVVMDALVIDGLDEGQITYLTAPNYLCPTHHYDVTFERGTRITYGDRTHYYLSGTASIDHKGRVLYPDQAVKQSQRALINVNALLNRNGASFEDLKQMIVYIRDFSDAPRIEDFIRSSLPSHVPMLFFHSSVCRPEWLVEIEGIAINNKCSAEFPAFSF